MTYRRKLDPLFLRHCSFVANEVEESANWMLWCFLLLLRRRSLRHLALEALACETWAARRRALDERSAFATPRLALATCPHAASLRSPTATAARPAHTTLVVSPQSTGFSIPRETQTLISVLVKKQYNCQHETTILILIFRLSIRFCPESWCTSRSSLVSWLT